LPADKVRHVGEAVAMVVAETLPQALDAAEAVEIEYEELPWIASSKSACRQALQRFGTKCRTMSSSMQYSATGRRLTGHSPAPTMSSQWIYILAG
jgi:CO/xanthine dehydrogenase Mo-binding subunit